jgi:hypothetical protein
MEAVEEVQIVAEWWDDGSALLRRSLTARPNAATPSGFANELAAQIAVCLVGRLRVAVATPQRPHDEADRRALARRIRDVIDPSVIAYQVSNTQGACRLDESLLEPAGAPFAAMAVAVVKASWGWDETPEIAVQIGSTVLLVEPAFRAGLDGQGRWAAKIARS